MGCEEDARIAFSNPMASWDVLSSGWRHLSSKFVNERTIYISPSDVVYKIDSYGVQNWSEHHASIELSKLHLDGWEIPPTELYKVEKELILAMPFIEGVTAAVYYGIDPRSPYSMEMEERLYNRSEVERFFDLDDLHAENIIVRPDGTHVIIDLGL